MNSSLRGPLHDAATSRALARVPSDGHQAPHAAVSTLAEARGRSRVRRHRHGDHPPGALLPRRPCSNAGPICVQAVLLQSGRAHGRAPIARSNVPSSDAWIVAALRRRRSAWGASHTRSQPNAALSVHVDLVIVGTGRRDEVASLDQAVPFVQQVPDARSATWPDGRRKRSAQPRPQRRSSTTPSPFNRTSEFAIGSPKG